MMGDGETGAPASVQSPFIMCARHPLLWRLPLRPTTSPSNRLCLAAEHQQPADLDWPIILVAQQLMLPKFTLFAAQTNAKRTRGRGEGGNPDAVCPGGYCRQVGKHGMATSTWHVWQAVAITKGSNIPTGCHSWISHA